MNVFAVLVLLCLDGCGRNVAYTAFCGSLTVNQASIHVVNRAHHDPQMDSQTPTTSSECPPNIDNVSTTSGEQFRVHRATARTSVLEGVFGVRFLTLQLSHFLPISKRMRGYGVRFLNVHIFPRRTPTYKTSCRHACPSGVTNRPSGHYSRPMGLGLVFVLRLGLAPCLQSIATTCKPIQPKTLTGKQLSHQKQYLPATVEIPWCAFHSHIRHPGVKSDRVSLKVRVHPTAPPLNFTTEARQPVRHVCAGFVGVPSITSKPQSHHTPPYLRIKSWISPSAPIFEKAYEFFIGARPPSRARNPGHARL